MAEITFPKSEYSLDHIKINADVEQMKKDYFAASPEVDIERPKLLTDYFLANGLFRKDQITALDAAKAYRHILKNRKPVIRHSFGYKKVKGQKGMIRLDLNDKSPFAGSTTSKSKGVILYPEWLALTLWPELHTMENRAANPFQLSNDDADTLNKEVFPSWINFNVMDLTRNQVYGNGEKSSPLLKLHDYLVFFLITKFQCISHTIPDFKKALGVGLRGVIDEAKAKQAQAGDQDQRDFYQAMIEGMEGIKEYSSNLAAKAEEMAQTAQGDEKAEFEEIARIYRKVPANPATTFREGLTTIWLCWIACHLENSNTGLSLGRLDQLLYPLYRADVDAGRLTPAEAVDLVCHLWLKIGDHVPSIPESGEQLFGGTGSNQAITLGGVDENEEDAVNDLTYVMLRATELMMLRDPNLNCRYHPKKSSREYLERICEVNVNTRATPAIHNDRAIIDAMMKKGESEKQARDYGVVGCVEPTSAGRGYMATGGILLNLASAFEMTLFNGRHRHTGDSQIGPQTGDPASFTSYQQFRDAFETQARWLMKQAVTLNNIAGEIHQKYHPTPILSTLFEGPMEKGKDLIFAGAERNASGVAVIGFADSADCLSAVEKKVYGDKSVTWDKLMDAL
ncbi:MAG: pyruvate formate lyase family protein, partial [Nitrospinota bacterium]|nr:pyruvate formate lyase family protein [Nitrospinota bacterium]